MNRMVTVEDRLTKVERRRGVLDDLFADCNSVLADFLTANTLLGEMAYEHTEAEEAFQLVEMATLLINKLREKAETGHV